MDTKDTPVAGEWDVVVAGAGMAGFGAACGAARAGAKTLLVERLSVLGGLGSAGGVGNFCYGGEQLVGHGAVFDQVWNGLVALGAAGEDNGWTSHYNEKLLRGGRSFDHAALPLVLQRIARTCGVELLLDTDLVGAQVQEGRVTQALVHNASLLQGVGGRVFIDGTGDGLLAQHAGARTLPLDDAEHPDMIKPSLMIFLRKTDEPQEQIVPEGDAADWTPNYSVWREPRGRIGLKLKMYDSDFDTGSGAGVSAAEAAHRAIIPAAVRHFQQHHDASYVFDFSSPLFGTREGRRIEGDYVLTIEDARAGCRFDDSVAYATYTVDTHRMGEIVPPYQIPYRSLLARGLENLLVAGRCLSADRLAMSSARIMPTCCLMGEAAGIAAAHACAGGVPLREVKTDAVRAALLENAESADFMRERLCP